MLIQGNVLFEEDSSHDHAYVKDPQSLQTIAHLLDVSAEDVEQALCSRVVAAKGEVLQKEHNVHQAINGRDAFAKVCPLILAPPTSGFNLYHPSLPGHL